MEAERRNNVVPSHCTVLNADADEAGRYATSQDLKKAGFTFLKAGTVEDALRGAAEPPDLILLDVSQSAPPDAPDGGVCRGVRRSGCRQACLGGDRGDRRPSRSSETARCPNGDFGIARADPAIKARVPR